MLRKFAKRTSCLAISFMSVFMLSVPCLAAVGGAARMTNIESASCKLVFENGEAIARARVTGVRGAEKCKIVLKIQEERDSRWYTVDISSVEQDMSFASASSSVKAKQGLTYRAQATVTVWVDGVSETKTLLLRQNNFEINSF